MSNLTLSILIGLINAVPILIWGSYFLHKHNEKRKWVLFSFSLGALSVVPLVFLRYFTELIPFLDLQNTLQANSLLQSSFFNIHIKYSNAVDRKWSVIVFVAAGSPRLAAGCSLIGRAPLIGYQAAHQ